MAKRRGKGEGSIFYREDRKRWVAQIKLEDGKLKTRSAKTQREASVQLKQMQRELEQGTLATGPHQTIGQFLEHWLERVHKPTIRESSYVRYRTILNQHLLPGLGSLQLQRLTPEHIEALYKRKQEEGLSARTIRTIHVVLHRALETAIRRRYIARNVCDDVSLPRLSRHEIQPLTSEQAHTLLAAAQGHRLECLLAVALATGMRRGELLALRWQDVDFEQNSLYVRHTVNLFERRGYIETEPKTQSSRRSIILPSFVIEALKRHRVRQAEARLKAGFAWEDHGLVFCNTYGRYTDPASLRRLFKGLLKQAGLPDMRFHDLRHSAATILLSMGVPAKVIQELLGHSQISMTLGTYSHVLPGMQQDAMDKWDVWFGP
jgi:integrase